jgi:dTDP-4-amino-4,6-dideoxygalactose transaminase
MSVAFTDWPPFRQHTLDLIETSLRTGKLADGPNTCSLEAAWKDETGAAFTLS